MQPGVSGSGRESPTSLLQSRCLGLAFAFALAALPGLRAGEVNLERLAYGGWPNCVRLSNGVVELVATTDVGPRVLRFNFPGAPSLFKEWPDQRGKTGGAGWRIYGGHRLWHGPESRSRTYQPDNAPVESDWNGQRLKLTQPVEPATGIQKEIEIALVPDAASATLVHRLINRGAEAVEAVPWAITVCQGPGRAIVPQEPYVAHGERLLPVRTLTLWAYTDMQDPRYTWGTKYIQVRSDPAIGKSQKIGFMNTVGWAAFERDGTVFLKRFAFDPAVAHADLGCNVEVYTSGDMLELETLGRLGKIAPGASVEHVERWYLFRAAVGDQDAALDAALTPLVRQTQPVTP